MQNKLHYCPWCMRPIRDDETVCPSCGNSIQVENEPHQLPVGTILNERYQVGRILGEGGFGITYIGMDLKLLMPVAIKEYYPSGMVNRYNTHSLELTASKGDVSQEFLSKKDRFLDEARTLAKFAGDSNIVCVRDYFEANRTAYIVMEYLEGVSLKEYAEQHGSIPFSQAYQYLRPVMLALDRIHQAGMIHRDISPSNLMLLKNGKVKLLDFGTARDVSVDGEKSLSIMLKPGYSPEEQYRSRGSQGPWTDVYAISASIYKLITGETPENSMNRLFSDSLQHPSQCGAEITSAQEKVLMKGMAVRASDRIQTMRELVQDFDEAGRGPDVGSNLVFYNEKTVYKPMPEQKTVQKKENTIDAPIYTPTDKQQLLGTQKKSVLKSEETAQDAVSKLKSVKPLNSNAAKREKDKVFHDESSKSYTPKKRNPRAIVAVIAVFAVIIGSIFALSRGGNPYEYDSGSIGSSIRDETITASMIAAIDRDQNNTSLNLTNCELSDDVVKRISEMKRIESLKLANCTGFSSLAPLASMEPLKDLFLTGDNYGNEYPVLDSDNLFPVAFPTLKYLNLSFYQLADKGEFLLNFSSLETLNLTYCRNELDLKNLANMSGLKRLSLNDEATDSDDQYETELEKEAEANAPSPEDHVSITNDDFSPLSKCVSLEDVEIKGMGVTTLTWAQSLTNLKNVEVSSNPLESLDGLSNHEALYSLRANKCQIADISGIDGCTHLHDVELTENQITDISVLSGCEELSSLLLSKNLITDVSALGNASNLLTLSLNDNEISDISPLSGCTSLQYLYLNRLQLTDLNACELMIDLKKLYAKDNQITDISGLKNTTQLSEVGLRDNQITDISPLAKNTANLKNVLLADNQIADLSPIYGCPNLSVLTIENNQITNLKVAEGASALRYLTAYSNQITDISGLSDCPSIAYLDLGENQITDITALSACTLSSQALFLQNNLITDISSLPTTVTQYEPLSLYGNPITSYESLSSMSDINHVWSILAVSWDQNWDYEQIARSEFENLYLVDVPIDQQANTKVTNRAVKKEKNNYITSDPNFCSKAEIDAKMDEIRDDARENEGTVIQGINVSDYFSSLG